MFNGTDTHTSTDWQLATDSGFSNIVEESLDDTSNKVSYTFGQGAYSFVTSTTYYIRVRHTGASFSDSAYSSTVSFTTNASFAGEQVYTTAGSYSFVPPTGVTSVSAIVVGAGGRGGVQSYYSGGGSGASLAWKNNISVTPGTGYAVSVPGTTNGADNIQGGTAYFINTSTV